MLQRVFFVDALTCPRCNVAMVVLAFLSDPAVVGRILRHLGLPDVAPPVAPARAVFIPGLFSCPQSWDGCDEVDDSSCNEEGEGWNREAGFGATRLALRDRLPDPGAVS